MSNAGNKPAQCPSAGTQPALIDGLHCALHPTKLNKTPKSNVGWVEQRETHQPNQRKPQHPSPAKLMSMWQMGIEK